MTGPQGSIAPRILELPSLRSTCAHRQVHALPHRHRVIPSPRARRLAIIEALPALVQAQPTLRETVPGSVSSQEVLPLRPVFVGIVLVVCNHGLAKSAVSIRALPSSDHRSLGIVVSVDHVSVLVVLGETGFGSGIHGSAVSGGCVQSDDAASVGRLFVEVFADFALPLRAVPFVDEEESEKDGEDESYDP